MHFRACDWISSVILCLFYGMMYLFAELKIANLYISDERYSDYINNIQLTPLKLNIKSHEYV